MSILITGGCGYIGSHIVWHLNDTAESVVVLDDLSTGSQDALPPDVPLYVGKVQDQSVLRQIARTHKIDAVIHLAASTLVSESVSSPLDYYENNYSNTISLLKFCVNEDVPHIVFSSTAAVYGDVDSDRPISETSPTNPKSPYGWSKLYVEQLLKDAETAYGIRHTVLRYFNVAGADKLGRTGQTTASATHLIKVACETALGKRAYMEIFGEDYPTSDGTCVRDYIHVSDLATAHSAALTRMRAGCRSLTMNCGYGRGYSVLDIIKMVRDISGRNFEVRHSSRRIGDCSCVIADPNLAQRELNWIPQYDDLHTIISSSFNWEARISSPKRIVNV